MTRILNDNDFESGRYFERNSALNKLASDKIRYIVGRLFQGTDINLDDFEFYVADNEEPNAWFINKSNTLNHKNIIAVTRGAIDLSDRIEILAAIIAHETGHYIWADSITDINSRIQEDSADVNSVNLMIRAGWNPQYITEMQEKLFGGSVRTTGLGVHGSPNERIISVSDEITIKSNEMGYFADIDKDLPDTDWKDFLAKFHDIYATEGYDTFIDKKLKQKFGTKDLKSLNRIDVLKFFLDLIKSGDDMNVGARFKDLYKKMKQFDFTNKTPDEITVLQDIFLTIVDRKSKHEFDFFGGYYQYGGYHDEYQDIFQNMLGHFKLESFGPFEEQSENVKNLMKYYDDEEKAVFYAKKIDELSWTVYYKKQIYGLKFPRYFEALGEKNVGKMLPWVKLLSYNRKEIDKIYSLICKDYDSWSDIYYSSQPYLGDEYYIENDIVVAYGEQARRLNKLRKDKDNLEKFESEKKYNLEQLSKKMDLFNNLALYIEGKISVIEFLKSAGVDFSILNTDFVEKIQKFVGISTRNQWMFPDRLSEYFDFYQKLEKSKVYDYFIKGSPELALYPEIAEDTHSSELINYIGFLLFPGALSKFNKLVEHGILKIADDLTKTGEEAYIEWASRIYKELDLSSKGDSYVWTSTSFDERRLELEWGLYHERLRDFIKKRDDAVKKIKEYRSEFVPEIARHASKNYFATMKLDGYLARFIEKELEKDSSSKSILDMMKSIGLEHLPRNESELIWAMEYIDSLAPEDYVSHENLRSLGREILPWVEKQEGLIAREVSFYLSFYSKPSENSVTKLMYILWAQYFKSGYKCNPINVIKYFEQRKNENSFDIIRELFYQGITVQNFKSLSLIEKFEIYEFMDARNLFDDKYANQSEFIKIIIDELFNSKDKSYIAHVAERILTRRSVTKYGKSEYDRDFEFAGERERLIEFYSQYWADYLGRDDGSDDFLKRVKDFTDFIANVSPDNQKRLFSNMISKNILNSVSNKVVAQERAAKLFADAQKIRVDGNKVNKYDSFVRAGEDIFNVLAKTPSRALATIRFLNGKLTNDSIETLINACSKDNEKYRDNITKLINRQTLIIIHENFWTASLELRVGIMERLLDSYCGTDGQKKVDLVVDSTFKKDSKYYSDAKLVLGSIYKIFPKYEHDKIISALLCGAEKDDNNKMSSGEEVGRGLKMFFQMKGGAFVKFGQLLSYLPTLDSGIRKELSTLRDQADIPTRDELFNMLRTSLPESEFEKISYVGKVLGGGSIYISVQVKYDGKDAVIALMRPNTRNKIESGIDVIEGTIDDMAAQDKKFEPLKNIVAQAKKSCTSEIDITQDYDKYVRAVKTYETFKVYTPTASYSPDVARWIKYGCDDDKNNAYKIMEMAPGKSLISSDWTEEEKHDMALAYVTLELSMLLSGARWDTDRHQGQQNFYDKSFRDFCIGIFDTGAQMDNAPEKADKVMLGHLFYELIRGARRGKSISDILNSNVQRIDSIGKIYRFDTSYIDGVQRGILALSDIMEYQKEIKDENGNIIQERKVLDEQDLQDIIVAIMDAGIIDEIVMTTVRAKAIINKLRILRPGWFKTLNEGLDKTRKSRIRIEYTGKVPDLSTIELFKKSIAEIERLQAEKKAGQHLGFDKDVFIKADDAKHTN